MHVLVSGLNECACGEFTGRTDTGDTTFRWCQPAEFVENLVRPAGGADEVRAVWLYRAPWSISAPADTAESVRDPGQVLAIWVQNNRAVLNARGHGGTNLLVANADRVSSTDLQAELRHPGKGRPDSAVAAPAFAGGSDALAKLFDLLAPQCWDIFEALEAIAWTSGSTPLFRGMCVPDESALHGLLRSMHDSDGLLQGRAELAREKSAHEEAKQEGELLLIQLHQVQEELEQYYLKNLDLEKFTERERKTAGDAQKKADVAQKESQALKLKLGEMQSELKLAQAAPGMPANEAGLSPQTRPTGSRIVPSPLRRVVARALNRRVQKTQRLRIDQSGWFDPGWYLDTYPDVRAAHADPTLHYLTTGWRENRNPGPRFDTAYYLKAYPDVLKSGVNPLWHYLEYGNKEGRLPRKP